MTRFKELNVKNGRIREYLYRTRDRERERERERWGVSESMMG